MKIKGKIAKVFQHCFLANLFLDFLKNIVNGSLLIFQHLGAVTVAGAEAHC